MAERPKTVGLMQDVFGGGGEFVSGSVSSPREESKRSGCDVSFKADS